MKIATMPTKVSMSALDLSERNARNRPCSNGGYRVKDNTSETESSAIRSTFQRERASNWVIPFFYESRSQFCECTDLLLISSALWKFQFSCKQQNYDFSMVFAMRSDFEKRDDFSRETKSNKYRTISFRMIVRFREN